MKQTRSSRGPSVLQSYAGTVPDEVGRTGAGDFLQPGERPANHLAVGEMAAANDAVDPFANQIDVALAFTDLQRHGRIAGEKLWQRGQQQGSRQIARHVHADNTGNAPRRCGWPPQGPPE